MMSERDETVTRRLDAERSHPDRQYDAAETMGDAPGLSGGEYPLAEEQLDVMSDELTPAGEATTFGGALGGYGPAGTMGTVDEGNAAETASAQTADDTQYGLGPASQ